MHWTESPNKRSDRIRKKNVKQFCSRFLQTFSAPFFWVIKRCALYNLKTENFYLKIGRPIKTQSGFTAALFSLFIQIPEYLVRWTSFNEVPSCAKDDSCLQGQGLLNNFWFMRPFHTSHSTPCCHRVTPLRLRATCVWSEELKGWSFRL